MEEKIIINRDELESQVEQKRLELEQQLNKKVETYIVYIDEYDAAVAFIRKPELIVKQMAIEQMTKPNGTIGAGQMILDSCLIKEASDTRCESDEDIYLTLSIQMYDTIKIYNDIVKKKSMKK